MRLPKLLIQRIYRLQQENKQAMLDKSLKVAAKYMYPEVIKQACYTDKNGNRRFYGGGTPQLEDAINTWIRFIEEYETTGTIDVLTFDRCIWTMHNNGYFADKFIEAEDEYDAIHFLNELGGVVR